MNDIAAATHYRPVTIVLPSLAGGRVERVMFQLAHHLLAQVLPEELLLAQASSLYLADVELALAVQQLWRPGVLRSLLQLVHYLFP